MKHSLRAQTDTLIGKVLLGRYRVVRELAKGGMGVVYLARAEGAVGFVKPVVIKLLLPEHAQDDRFVGMFVREAQILSQLRHPSLVDVLEFGEQDDAYVLVLEYVRGYHLGQWLRFLAMKRREPPPDILIQIVIDVLEALHHAHTLVHPDGSSMQIVHRDVSPSNILLDENGRGRLLDFGVARMRGGAHDYKTQVKGFMGKLPYTAPELFANAEASARSDLYACAVVLHEAMLGENVFRTEMQAATLHKVMTHIPEPVEHVRRGVPSGLDEVLAKALLKKPEQRYTAADDFASALRRLQSQQESDIRAHLAGLLKEDFGADMSQLLNLESLAHRDEAWRRLSHSPQRRDPVRKPGLAGHHDSTVAGTNPLPVPAAAGATVAHSPQARAARLASTTLDGYEFGAPPALTDAAPGSARPTRASQAVTRPPEAPALDGERAGTASRPLATQQPLAAGDTNPRARTGERRRSQRWFALGLGLVGALALLALGLVLLRPAAPPNMPPIRVVAAPSDAPVARLPVPRPEQAAAQLTQPEKPAPELHVAPGLTAADPKRSQAADRSRRTGLTLAFRRQQPRLEACFKQHSVALDGQPTTELEFDLDSAGKLTRVGLTPRTLAGTVLGECLLQVARSTQFPAQGQAVSFTIPLTARRASDG